MIGDASRGVVNRLNYNTDSLTVGFGDCQFWSESYFLHVKDHICRFKERKMYYNHYTRERLYPYQSLHDFPVGSKIVAPIASFCHHYCLLLYSVERLSLCICINYWPLEINPQTINYRKYYCKFTLHNESNESLIWIRNH